MGNRRGVFRQANAVHPHAVAGHMLAGHDGGPSGHADHVLVMGAAIVNAAGGQRINGRCARHAAAVAAQCVIAHLIRGDEEYFSAHLTSLRVFVVEGDATRLDPYPMLWHRPRNWRSCLSALLNSE